MGTISERIEPEESRPARILVCIRSLSLQSPITYDSAEELPYATLLETAKKFVQQLGEHYGEEIWTNLRDLFRADSPPSSWSLQLGVAIRSGVASAGGLAYSVHMSNRIDWIWSAAEVLAPIVAILAVQENLGSTVMVISFIIKGAFVGIFFTIGIVAIALSASDENHYRDALSFALFTACIIFLCSRKLFSYTERKIACAVLVIGTFSPTIARYEGGNRWYQPVVVLLPCLVGCFCSLVVMLLPYPRLASSEVIQRLMTTSDAISFLLHEQTALVLRKDMKKLVHSEFLLSSILKANISTKKLIPAAFTELELMPWKTELSIRIKRTSQYLASMARRLRVSQIALKSLNIKRQSDVQILFLSFTSSKWIKLNHALVHLSRAVVARTLDVSLDPFATTASENIQYVHTEAVQALKEFETSIAFARSALFPTTGWIRRAHERYIHQNYGATQDGAPTYGYPYTSDARINGGLYSMPFRNFTTEQCRRYAHMFCVIDYSNACIETDFCFFVDGQRETAAAQQRYLTSWIRYVAFWLIRGPESVDALIVALKPALAIVICGLLTYIPGARLNLPQSMWAAVTACFVQTTEGTSGASIFIGTNRILGTTMGAAFGMISIAAAFAAESTLTRMGVNLLLLFLLGCWVGLTGLFRANPLRGYAAVVAGFTAALIIQVSLEVEGSNYLARQLVAWHRIEMTFVGVVISVAVEILVVPRSAREIVLKGVIGGLSAIIVGAREATDPTNEAESTISFKGGHEKLQSGVKDLKRTEEQLIAANEEPLLWRGKFHMQRFTKVIDLEMRCLQLLTALRGTIKLMANSSLHSLPCTKLTITKFSRHVEEAAEEAGKAWTFYDKKGRRRPSKWTKNSIYESEQKVDETQNLDAFCSAARIAMPLLALRDVFLPVLLEERDAIILEAFQCNSEPDQNVMLGWMTSCFICYEIAEIIGDLGKAIVDLRGSEIDTMRQLSKL